MSFLQGENMNSHSGGLLSSVHHRRVAVAAKLLQGLHKKGLCCAIHMKRQRLKAERTLTHAPSPASGGVHAVQRSDAGPASCRWHPRAKDAALSPTVNNSLQAACDSVPDVQQMLCLGGAWPHKVLSVMAEAGAAPLAAHDLIAELSDVTSCWGVGAQEGALLDCLQATWHSLANAVLAMGTPVLHGARLALGTQEEALLDCLWPAGHQACEDDTTPPACCPR